MASKKNKVVSAKEFYNEIADQYDDQLSIDKDKLIRSDVETYVKKYFGSGVVLDFGGGTGLDLSWLLQAELRFTSPSRPTK